MLYISKNDILHVKLHDFKDNISRYIRWLRAGKIQSIIVKRHNEPVGLFIPIMNGEFVDTRSENFIPDDKALHAVEVERIIAELNE